MKYVCNVLEKINGYYIFNNQICIFWVVESMYIKLNYTMEPIWKWPQKKSLPKAH